MGQHCGRHVSRDNIATMVAVLLLTQVENGCSQSDARARERQVGLETCLLDTLLQLVSPGF